MPQEVAVIEFGSSEITVIIARRGINNTFDIRGVGKARKAEGYDGFFNGEWITPEKLRTAIKNALAEAERIAQTKIHDLFVGVPAEFSTAAAKEVSLTFKAKQRITPNEIEMLYKMGDTFAGDTQYMVINRSPVYYTLDDGGRVIDPVGLMSSVIVGKLSYILAKKEFLKKINAILADFNFKTVEYVSSMLAESLYLFEADQRDRGVLLADIGFLTTGVTAVQGDGLIHLSSVSTGGAHIEYDLLECLGLKGSDYAYVSQIKRQVALSLAVGDTDKYEVPTEHGVLSVSARLVHEIILARLEYMAGSIKKCFERSSINYRDKKYRLYVTGGGISYMRGAVDALGRFLDKPCEIASGGIPRYNRPSDAAEYGLLDLALKNIEPRKSFLEKLLG